MGACHLELSVLRKGWDGGLRLGPGGWFCFKRGGYLGGFPLPSPKWDGSLLQDHLEEVEVEVGQEQP